jgi:hypothetical protein
MDEGTEQATKEKITALTKQVLDAYSRIGSTKPAADKTDRAQVKASINQFMERCKQFLDVRNELYVKQVLAVAEIYKETKDESLKSILAIAQENLTTSLMDNSLFVILITLVHTLIEGTSDLDSIRNRMNTYAEVMSKFKTLVDAKSGNPAEDWFGKIWDRQVKRGVIT